MGFFMPFYLIRGMGAGDVKLMGAAGSLLGKALAFKAVLAAAIVEGHCPFLL
jgi:prepilin peptidase CpaA